MTTARTLVRFAFAGLFANALAVACVVSDGDDKNDDNTACDPGSYKDCTCSNGDEGTKKCNASGSGYSTVCDCGGSTGGAGNAGGEGNTPTAGTANTAGSINYGGETSGGGADGQGGEGGGTMSQAGAGGEGGAAIDPEAVCFEDPEDTCQECVQQDCCVEWQACRADPEDCEQQMINIIACVHSEIAGDVTPAELESCAQNEGTGSDPWAQSVLPTTKAVVDCMAGGTGWAAKTDFESASCNNLCFVDL
jgi:hypothetical protein